MDAKKVIKELEHIFDDLSYAREILKAFHELGDHGNTGNVNEITSALIGLKVVDHYIEELQLKAYEIIFDAEKAEQEG